MICLRILEDLESRADQLLAEVHSGTFHKLQAVLIHNDAHPSLLEHPEMQNRQETGEYRNDWSKERNRNC